jgi:hypothetical protein
VDIVERNTCNAVTRGIAVLPASKNTSRAEGSRRKLGDPAFDRWRNAPKVRIGKVRSRSR